MDLTLELGNLRLTVYAIERDHSRHFGPFRVENPTTGARGLGFQAAVGKAVYGASLTWPPSPEEEDADEAVRQVLEDLEDPNDYH